MRTLILSDLHLGSRSSRATAQLSALERAVQNFDRVILNGDTLDRYEAVGVRPENDRLAEQARAALTPRRGRLEIICGNHDPAFSEQTWSYLEASRTLVFHGDFIQDWTHPTKRADRMLREHLAEVWRQRGGRPTDFTTLATVYRDEQRRFLQRNPSVYESKSKFLYLLKAFFPPVRPFHVFAYWHRAPGRVEALARTFARPVQNVVFGHSHRAGDWLINGVRVINTGSFMPLSTPMAVCTEGSTLHTLPVSELLRSAAPVFLSQPVAPKV